MRRREFITFVGTSAAAWPLAARAQQASGMWRIGVLMGTPAQDAESKAELAGFRDSLAKLGWIEGSTIHIDYRFPANPDQYPILAKELIALRPEVIWHNQHRLQLRCSGKLELLRSYLQMFQIRSAGALSRAWRGRAAISLADSV